MPDKTFDPPLTLAYFDGLLFATVPEAASVLRYHPDTLRQAIADGDVPAVRAGATHRIPVAWIRAQAEPQSDITLKSTSW